MKAEIRCRRVAHCGSPFARAVTSRGATIRHGDETTTVHRGGGEREERLEPTVRTAKNEVSMRRLPRNRPTCAAPESARRPHAWPESAQPWHPESSVASLPSCRQRPHIRKHPASRSSRLWHLAYRRNNSIIPPISLAVFWPRPGGFRLALSAPHSRPGSGSHCSAQ